MKNKLNNIYIKMKIKCAILMVNIVYIWMLYPVLIILIGYLCYVITNIVFSFPVAYADFGTIKLIQVPGPIESTEDFPKLLEVLKASGLTEIQAKDFIIRLNEKYRQFFLLINKNEVISNKVLLKFQKDIYFLTKPFTKNLSMEQLNVILFESTSLFDKFYFIPLKYQYSFQIITFQLKDMLNDIQDFSFLKYPNLFQILFEKFSNGLVAAHMNQVLAHKIYIDLCVILEKFIETSENVSPTEKVILYYDFMESVGKYLDYVSQNYKMDSFLKFIFKSYSNNLYLIFNDVGHLYKFSLLISDVHYSQSHTFRMFNDLQALFYCKHNLVSKGL
jgi:hypothetical protein